MNALRRLMDSSFVANFIALAIGLNAVTIFVGSYDSAADWMEHSLGIGGDTLFDTLDQFFIGIFCLELLLKLVVQRAGFFRNPWNIFDALVTLPAFVPGFSGLSSARVIRVLRILRLFSSLTSFRMLLTAMMRSLSDAVHVCYVAAIMVFVFAAMGNSLWGQELPDLFGNVGLSMVTFFRAFAFYEAPLLIAKITTHTEIATVMIVTFFIVMNYIIVNFFIAIAMFYIFAEKSEQYAAPSDEVDCAMAAIRREIEEIRCLL